VRNISGYILIIVFLLSNGCAQQGAPTGGPIDEDPPILLSAEPANYSINFTDKKILLTFDEFLDMGNFVQELVVSPPMDEKPEIKLRNKTLIIEFEEELKEDITYTFNFGEGIKDLNERNILMNFEYVFSTGDYLDSLSIKGRLKNAFDLSIIEPPIYVMLYTEQRDSLPLIDIPYYVGRSDKEGNFAVNNLRPDDYKLFVLKDGNNNFLFDLPAEEIAFLDSSLLVDAEYFKTILLESGKYDSSDFVQDTIPLAIDTTSLSADTIAMMLDSIALAKPDLNSIFVDLFMFTEDPENQFVSDYSREKKNRMELLFNISLTDSFAFTPLFPESLREDDFIADYGKTRDTLILWAADTLIAAIDTIDFRLTYTVKDTLNQDVMRNDTLSLVYKEPKKANTRKKDPKKPKEAEKLKVNTIRSNGRQNIHQKLRFSFDVPLGGIDSSRFDFFIIPDTIDIPMDVVPLADSNSLYTALIDIDWPTETTYKMIMYPGAFHDIYGATHDTINVRFTTKALSDYGIIKLNLTNVEDTVLIQLSSNKRLTRQLRITSSGTYIFENLDPSKYRIKFVHDNNLNDKWDTGKYMEDLQAERVEYYPMDINVRSNWDHDVDYEMGSNDTFPVEEKKEETEDSILAPPSNNSNFNNNPNQGGNIPTNNNVSPSRRPTNLTMPADGKR
jgi:hypothetical protein